MGRIVRLLLLPLCLATVPALAAAPAHPTHPRRHVVHKTAAHRSRVAPRGSAGQAQSLPSPAGRGDGFAAAPVPDEDASAPIPLENLDPHVTPTLFHLTTTYNGDGYVYGSSPQGMDDTRALNVPGVELKVPIH